MKTALLFTSVALSLSYAQLPSPAFNGVWLNDDPDTRSITKVEFHLENNALMVHVWGKCHPYDCDWGEKESAAGTSGKRHVEWNTGLSRVTQDFAISPDGRMLLVTFTTYTDNSGRSNLQSTDYMVKVEEVRVRLQYRTPGHGPKPDFSPRGTQVQLTDLAAGTPLPAGAVRPARIGMLFRGREAILWILVTAASDHPKDLCRLYIDRNRNGNFTDDGPPLMASLTMNPKTRDWWSSFGGAEISIPYGNGIVEPYTVNFWAVRAAGQERPPEWIRYSVASWRSGEVTVGGIQALVAVMDANNDAIFDSGDDWSVLGASEPDAARRLLSNQEAHRMDRLMFLPKGDGKELVLEFRSISPDGRSLVFAVVDRPVRKIDDRAPDDTLAAERARPRAAQPFVWESSFDQAMARAKASGRKLIVDFWTSWCGPCHTLDEWIWTDAEVAAVLNAGYVGIRLDGDLEKAQGQRFHVGGYPTIIILDPAGKELQRLGYVSSREMLQALR